MQDEKEKERGLKSEFSKRKKKIKIKEVEGTKDEKRTKKVVKQQRIASRLP